MTLDNMFQNGCCNPDLREEIPKNMQFFEIYFFLKRPKKEAIFFEKAPIIQYF